MELDNDLKNLTLAEFEERLGITETMNDCPPDRYCGDDCPTSEYYIDGEPDYEKSHRDADKARARLEKLFKNWPKP